MTAIEASKERIKGLSPNEVRELAVDRLHGTNTTPIVGGCLDEPSEDLLISLLQAENLVNDVREAVIGALKSVCIEVLANLERAHPSHSGGGTRPDWTQIAIRLCRVLDVCSPPELESLVSALLGIGVTDPELDSLVRAAIVRAAMGYPRVKANPELWARLLEVPELAAYAFNAILDVSPNSARVEGALVSLLVHQVVDQWGVDTPFLMRRAARARGSDEVIRRVLDQVRAKCSKAEWNQIRGELQKRSWSAGWPQLVEPNEPCETYLVLASDPNAEPPCVFMTRSHGDGWRYALRTYLLRWLRVTTSERGRKSVLSESGLRRAAFSAGAKTQVDRSFIDERGNWPIPPEYRADSWPIEESHAAPDEFPRLPRARRNLFAAAEAD